MNWLMNTWYAAAWSSDIVDKPLGRTLLNLPVVFFRSEDGALSAIGGRCPHRFAPLAMGTVVGKAIQCAYHGLQFDGTGVCVHNPHGEGKIPKAARVPSYPVEEKWGLVWFWPGNPAKADASMIPDLSHLGRTDMGHVTGYMGMDAHYELGVDNLIDLSHVQFVHGDRLGSSQFSQAAVVVKEDGARVSNCIFIPNSEVPPIFQQWFDQDCAAVDLWLDSFWQAPSIVTNDTGATLPGASRDEGYRTRGLHIVTPATRHSSHYLFANSRNRAIDDPEVDFKIREWQRIGFGIQDKPIIEATGAMMGDVVNPMDLNPVLLPSDAGALRARRVLARLIAEEAPEAAEIRTPVSAIARFES